MTIVMTILQTVLIFAAVLGSFYVLKRFVFSKFKINKWIPLGIALVLFLLQFFLKIQTGIQGLGMTAVTLLFFMWFLDLNQGGLTGSKGSKNEKQITIRPKAKPNRVKNMNKGKKDK